MKKLHRILTCGVSSALVFGLASCSKPEPEKAPEAAESASAPTEAAPSEFASVEQKVSYGIGRNIGSDMARNAGFEADLDALVAGIKDGVEGREPQLSDDVLDAAFAEIRTKVQDAAQRKSIENAEKSEAFLAENGSRADVVTTDSGLQYEVLTEGSGPKPTPSSTVKVHYHGTLVDGTVFDSSVQRGEPIEFPVMGVISGWTEALQLMPVGSKWKLFIPANLAYGDQDNGTIPPASALIFEVELLEIL